MTIETDKLYTRFEDMSHEGNISVFIQKDGDAILQIVAPGFIDNKLTRLNVEFCTHGGGGQSPEVLKALYNLAEAIELDNLKNPQYRR